MKLASGVHLAIHEAALVDYAGMWLRRVTGQRLKAELSPSSSGTQGRAHARHSSRPGARCRSPPMRRACTCLDLILNLNEPNKLGDVSWVKPFKYVGIWWGMHLGTHTWASGRQARGDHGRDAAATSISPRPMASAACWSKAGTRAGMATGSRAAMNSASPSRIRISTSRSLAAYAKKKGVHLVGHHETAGNIAVYEQQLGRGARSLPEAGHRLGQDRLRGRRRRHAGAGVRWAHPLRVARRPGAGAPSPAGGAPRRPSATSR